MSTPKSNQRRDPFPNYRFRVEISGIAQANFCEVTIPDSTNEVIAVRDGTEAADLPHKREQEIYY